MFLSNVFLYHQLHDSSCELYYNIATSHNITSQESYASVKTDLNISVMKGDRIGVQVVSGCEICPVMPAIVAFQTSSCLAQVPFNSENDVNNLETITNVFLNVRA